MRIDIKTNGKVKDPDIRALYILMEAVKTSSKNHYCFNCGREAEDWDELPNGRRLYICEESECHKEFRDACGEIESEARARASEDNYREYY